MPTRSRLFIWLFIIGCGIVPSRAQKIAVGADAGGFLYKGDLAPRLNPRFFRPGGSLFFRYNPKTSFSLRAQLSRGILTADDQFSSSTFQIARDQRFRTGISDASVLVEYNFLDYKNRRSAINWTPYVFGGVGYSRFVPKWVEATYPTRGWVLPFGVGVKYEINRPWSIGLEFSTRKTFTDYLDNLGGEPVTNQKLDQGNPALRDLYQYVGLSLSYTFYRIDCPK
jgi:hypothetical protein